MFYVLIYLVAIVLANMIVLWFGPASTIINAFFLIGLDLSLRDKLHDLWSGNGLIIKMGGLIVTGSVITYLLNSDAGMIAVASVTAFSSAALFDSIIYALLRKKTFLIRSNFSNIGGALLDSALFPTIAFGIFLPWIILGQFTAKMAGGFLWSLLLNKYKDKKVILQGN
ncbi:MAG: hypothetical protein SCALA702_08370 [Melioribacteraceae bacterium]|nr:MAG: hypothetical protein SCALA702_08370 [Melioribacteraceae bacterium]